MRCSLFAVLLSALVLVHRASCDAEAPVGLQSIVPEFDSAGKDVEASHNWTSMAEALDVFSVRNLARNWPPPSNELTRECESDIARYLQGLRRQELWALKMDDATGRFSQGFYWGNSYFTGSATECEYIGQGVSALGQASLNHPEDTITQAQFNVEQPQKKLVKQLAPTPMDDRFLNDRPPYPLGFYVLRISVNGSILPMPRVVYLGACLPFSCNSEDVTVIAKLGASDYVAKHSFVDKVKDQHNYYDMSTDPMFWLLFVITAITAFMLIVGTCYDLYLIRRVARKQKMNFDLEKHVKLDQFVNGNGKHRNASQGRTYIPVPVNEQVAGVTSVVVNNNNDHEGNLRPPTPDLQKLNVFEEILLSFSVRENSRVICDSAVGRDTLSTVHGLRTLSMLWVILGHTCIIVFKYSDNMEYRKVVEKRFLFQTIQNGAFSVDTFFFMGGLLVSFLYFRTNAKGDLHRLTQGTQGFVEGFLKFLGFLAYRFCRLTAPYMYVLGVTMIAMKWFHYNSVFEPPTMDHENCANYWWRNLLYINTLFPVDQMCMIWSWYVADDTQFYVVGAIILIVATNHFKIAALSLTSLMVLSWVTTGYIALANGHMPNKDDPFALFDKIYSKPWTRSGPYIIGMCVGYFLFKTDRKIKMSKSSVFIGWLLSTAVLLSLLFGLYEAELSPIAGAAYSALSHTAWALSLAWIVIACSTGYGGYVNKILSAPQLYPFSRLTYCAYLVHPVVIRMTAMSMDSPLHLSKSSMAIMYFGQVVASYLVSVVISLAFEAPVVSLLKILSPNKRNRSF